MARLLVKNNRLAVRNGRLVTTAGGAPCCCGDGEPTRPCECVPNAPVVVGDTYPLCPLPASGVFPPYRVRTLQARYSLITSETVTTARQGIDYRPIPPVNVREEETVQTITSTTVFRTVCYSATGSIELEWRIEIQGYRVSSTRGVLEQTNEVYLSSLVDTYPPDVIRPLIRLTVPLANDQPLNERCNYQETQTLLTETRRFPPNDFDKTITQTLAGQYTNSTSGGVASQSSVYKVTSRLVTYLSYAFFVGTATNDTERTSIERRDWTYQLDLCDGSGGGSGDRPGNCAGCGDASRLTIV